MPSTSDISKAASILARVQEYLAQKGVEEHDDDLNSMIDLFESPIFRQMVQLRNSIDTLNKKAENKDFNPNDVDFSIDSGTLVVGGKELTDNNDLSDALVKEPLKTLKEYIKKEANGRLVEEIELFKYPNESLGFSVIGLRSDYRGDLGIFVNELTPGGMASRDGRLKEEDQILAINSTPLSPTGSHQQAIQLLQSCKGLVKLIVARGAFPQAAAKATSSQSSTSDLSSLTQETAEINWSHVETIELTNTGRGLGFGIVGGRATGGVVVKTIVPGGAADTDGRLRSGDHILRIEDTDLQDMNSEQVAVVLRKCGTNVRLMVARREETEDDTEDDVQDIQTEIKPPTIQPRNFENPTKEIYEVELVKDTKGLGITISGCLQEDADDFDETGVFVNGIKPGSASDIDGQIKEGDQIIAVDGNEFEGMSSKEAVQILRNTGVVVRLTMARLIKPGTTNHEQQEDEDSQEIASSDGSGDNEDFFDVISQKDPDDVVIDKWKNIMGDGYEIIVAEMRKFNISSGLGISLEGRVDINDCPHHYLRSILPEGPVGLNGKLKVGDELLEVNNNRLLTLNHLEVVVILKELPINVRMVCARPLTITEYSRDAARDSVVLQENEEGELVEFKLTSEDGDLNQQQWESSAGDFVTSSALSHEVETSSMSSSSSSEIHSSTPHIKLPGLDQLGLEASGPEPMSQSPVSMERGSFSSHITPRPSETATDNFEDPLPLFAEVSEHWNSNIEYIDLYKQTANTGLGFSILELPEQEYERTAVVVSGLLEEGVAHTDGRLEPGDRLVFVNNIDLTSSDLDQAVDALKSIPSGNVKIGIVKPKPQFKDQFFNEDIEEEDEELEEENVEDIPDVVTAVEESISSEDANSEAEMEEVMQEAQHEEFEQSIAPPSYQEVEHSLPKQNSTSSNNNYEVKQIKMSGMTAIAITTTNTSTANQQAGIRANTPSPQPPVVPPKPQNYHPTYNSAPSWQHSHQLHHQKSEGYERMVHINKGESSLGLSVRPDKEGDGLLVVKVTDGGAVSLAGEPQPGDMIRKMNHDSAVGLGSMQARSLIINHSKYSQHVAISYIPSHQIQAFKSGVPYFDNKQQQQTSVNEEPPSRWQQFAAIKSIFEQPTPYQQDDINPRVSQIESAQLSSSMWGTYQGVEIVKDHHNDSLGLEIVGGRGEEMPLLASGEPLQGIFVSSVEEGGCLHRDGRVKPGDKILKVGMFDLTNASHQEAIEAFEEQQKSLRTSLIIQSFISKSLKPSSIFESLRYYRVTYKEHQKEQDDQYNPEDIELLQKYSHVPGEKSVVRLIKGPNGLGISMAGNKEKKVFVIGVKPDGEAGKSGKILVGDQLLDINNCPLDGDNNQQLARQLISTSQSQLTMVVCRQNDGEFKTIKLVKDFKGLGFSITTCDEGICVKSIARDGTADRDGRLQPNDVIIAVDGHSLSGVPCETATQILKQSRGVVKLKIKSPANGRGTF